MNIFTVRDNLKNTIKGKRELLLTYIDPDARPFEHRLVKQIARDILTINIDELTRILADVEICCNEQSS